MQYNNRFYQILDTPRTDRVQVEESLNGKVHLYHKDKELKFKIIDKRHQKPTAPYKPRKKYMPAKNHPYKLLFKKLKRKQCA